MLLRLGELKGINSKCSYAKTIWKKDIAHIKISADLLTVLRNSEPNTLFAPLNSTEPENARSFSKNKNANSEIVATSCMISALCLKS